MARRKEQPKAAKQVVETFRRPGYFEMRTFCHENYSVFNGDVHVRRWRVTVEPIEEADDVIYARLLDLWERSANMHDWKPLQEAAKGMGRVLPMERVGKRKAKKEV